MKRFLTAALLLAPGALAAQEPIRVARPAHITTPPQVDGRKRCGSRQSR